MADAAYDIPDYLRSRIHEQTQDSPILSLYELRPTEGDPIRLVSVAYPQLTGGSVPGNLPWNGEEFRVAHIERNAIPDNSEGRRTEWTVSVSDSKGEGAALVRQYGALDGATVRIWTTTLDGIEQVNRGDATVGDVAFVEEYFVTGVVLQATPRTMTVTLGYPKLSGRRYPSKKYERGHCINEYHQRHKHAEEPLCNYPSNEFGGSTAQNLRIGATPWPMERRFGWSTQQATQADEFEVFGSIGVLHIESEQESIQLFDDKRFAPNLFRVLDGDFDVYTRAVPQLDNVRAGWFGGLLIQDEADFTPAPSTPGSSEEEDDSGMDDSEGPDSSWLFWGVRDNGSGSFSARRRETIDNITTDTGSIGNESYVRVERIGSTINLYSANPAPPSAGGLDFPGPWTLRLSATAAMVAALPSSVRIGLVAGADVPNTEKLSIEFPHIRFLKGGLPNCQKRPEDCELRKMLHRANFFRRLPRARVRA